MGRTMFMDLKRLILNHNLLLAKLHVYRFSFNVIKFVHSYLSELIRMANINNNFSEWWKIPLGVAKAVPYQGYL